VAPRPDEPPPRPGADDPARRIVVVCAQGYSSSLAARTLRELGLSRATDLEGGYLAWRAWRESEPSA